MEIVCSRSPGESRIAVLGGAGPVAFLVLRDGDARVGSVHRGRVVGRVQGAVLVDFGQARPGFLQTKDQIDEGAALMVRVTRAAWGSKGAKLAHAPDQEPSPGPDPLLGLLTADVERVVFDDGDWLVRTRAAVPAFADKMVLQRGAFPEEEFEEALEPEVALPSGGSLIIETTAAATTMDVNAGPGGDANREAVAEVARQLRLRNIGGHVLVDFIPTKNKEVRRKLADYLRQAVADDPVPVHIVGTTPLGMVELTRERRYPSLAEVMLEASPERNETSISLACLRAAVGEGMASKASPVTVIAHQSLVARLQGPMAKALAEAEAVLGCPLNLQVGSVLSRRDFVITTGKERS